MSSTFLCYISYEDKYFSAFFSPGWVDGGAEITATASAATNYPPITNQSVWAEQIDIFFTKKIDFFKFFFFLNFEVIKYI